MDEEIVDDRFASPAISTYATAAAAYSNGLDGQAATIWRSLAPLVSERSLAEALDADSFSQRLQEAREVVWDLESALNETVPQAKANRFSSVWFHRRPDQVNGISKVERERIDRDSLLDATGKYLARPWMQHPEIDWIVLDSLIYAELTAFREAILSGTLVGTMNWSHILAGGNQLKSMYFRLIGAVAAGLARYVLPPVAIWALIQTGREQTATTVAGFYGLYLLARLVTWPNRRRMRKRLQAALTLLEKMVAVYSYCNPPVINPSVLRTRMRPGSCGNCFDGVTGC